MLLFAFFGALLALFLTIIFQVLPSSVRALLPDAKDEATLPSQYVWSVLLIIFSFNVFAYDNDVRAVGMSAFVALSVIAMFCVLPRSKRTVVAWVLMTLGVAASAAFSFRANEFVQSVNGVTAFVSLVGLLLLHATDRFEWNAAWILRTMFFYPALVFQRLPGGFRLLKPGRFTGASILVRVIGITVVLIIFFAALLSSGDPIFAEKISVLREEVVPRAIASILLSAFFVLALIVRFGKQYTYRALPLSFLSWIETFVPVAAVCVLFGVFLWVQATYLFADHESFKALDLTYAEYVRKGMIEVLIATACGGVLSYVVSLKERELTGVQERRLLSFVNAVLLLELFLMLGSAWKRDLLYMEVYGLTRVRVVGEMFLAWLAVVVVLLTAFALWKRLREKAVFAGIITACIAVVLLLNVCNMDARIVSAEQPVNQKLDVFYMSLLSVDAVDEWQEMISSMAFEFEVIRTKNTIDAGERMRLAMMALAVQQLHDKRSHVWSFEGGDKWRGWRWSDTHARKTMSGSVAFSQTLDCLREEIADYRTIHRLELAEETSMLLSGYVRPFVYDIPYSYDDFPYMAARTNVTADSCMHR